MRLSTFNTSVNNGNVQWQTGRIANIALVNNQAYVTVVKDDKWVDDTSSTPIVYYNQYVSSDYKQSLLEDLLIPLDININMLGALERLKNRSVTVQVVKYDDQELELATIAKLTPEPIIKKDERLLIERALRYGDNDIEYLSEEHLARIVQWGGSSELVNKLKKATKFTEEAIDKFILTPLNNKDTINGYKRSLTEEEIDDIVVDFEAGFIESGEVYPIKSALCHLPIRAMGGK